LQGLTSPSHDPFAFLDRLRDRTHGPAHGGWGFTWGFRTTDATSTSLVLQASAARGTAVPSGGREALRRLQYQCGAVAYSWKHGARTGPDLGATIGAILGFLRAPLPVPTGTVTGRVAPAVCR